MFFSAFSFRSMVSFHVDLSNRFINIIRLNAIHKHAIIVLIRILVARMTFKLLLNISVSRDVCCILLR